ncbi:crossover junction endodeoxyribonuclease RuvC [Candidatus Uhrbacteria bacterium]|nr:crossover junction endodeoxyribonuclease RuvC [Candidatus Uhrbacteria bacterium]
MKKSQGSGPRFILGIDPGFGRMGFGVIGIQDGQMEAVDFGVMTTAAGGDFGDRLAQLVEDLHAVFTHWKPSVVAVEQLFFTNNQKTAIRVAEARGVVLLTAAQFGVPTVEFNPKQVKLALTGDGNANKAAVQRMVKQLLGLPKAPKPDDAADALAIALTASTWRG